MPWWFIPVVVGGGGGGGAAAGTAGGGITLGSVLFWGSAVVAGVAVGVAINIADDWLEKPAEEAEVEGIQLDDEVAFFIAKHLRSNVRELEGALKKVLAYSSFHGRAIALDLAKEALKDVIGSVRNVGIDNIQKTVADYYKIKVADLFSKKRTRAIARPRQVAMWLCREVTSHSFPEIGDAFGGRDHTTVIHAVKTIDSLRSKENELNHDLHVLLQVLKG